MALPTSVSLSSPVSIFMKNAYLEVLFGTDIFVFSIGWQVREADPKLFRCTFQGNKRIISSEFSDLISASYVCIL
jgi:hypothetical protein